MSSNSNESHSSANSSFVRGQIVTGTVADFVDQGDDFLLNTAKGQWRIDPNNARADRLGLKLGETVQIQVWDLDSDDSEIEAQAIARADGTIILGQWQAAPSSSSAPVGAASTFTHHSDDDWDHITGQWFNSQDYLNRNPDVARSNMPAFQHFVKNGATEGRSKTLFDEQFYLTQNTDVRLAQQAGTVRSGWDHFIKNGATEGRLPTANASLDLVREMAQSFQQIRLDF